MAKDPVCGMEIDPKTAIATRMHTGRTFYFCSQSCAEKFDADPQRYGTAQGRGQHEAHDKPDN